MKRRTRPLVWIAVSWTAVPWIVGCGGGSPPAASTPAAVDTTPAPSASAPPAASAATSPSGAAPNGTSFPSTPPPPPSAPVSAACKVVAAEQEAGIKALKSSLGTLDPMSHAPGVPEEVAVVFSTCRPTSGGAWGLALRDVKGVAGGVGGRVVVVHATTAGAKAEGALHDRTKPTDEVRFTYVEATQTAFEAPRVGDVDGDGEAELFVTGQVRTKDTHAQPFGYVVAFQHGAVVAYPPAAAFDFFRAEDIDHDGRLDLLLRPYRDYVKDACDGTTTLVEGPPLAAHALPDGTFSTTDAAAVAFAKGTCPEKPKTIVSRIEGSQEVDQLQTAIDVACARIWGDGESTVLGAIQRECGATSGDPCSSGALATCRNAPLLRAWAQKRPGVVVK